MAQNVIMLKTPFLNFWRSINQTAAGLNLPEYTCGEARERFAMLSDDAKVWYGNGTKREKLQALCNIVRSTDAPTLQDHLGPY